MIRVALALILAATMACAGGLDLSGTIITLQPALRSGAVAEVWVQNRSMNSEKDNGKYPLSFDGVTVMVQFIYTSGADTIIITPPESLFCVPSCTLQSEDAISTIFLFSRAGVGA